MTRSKNFLRKLPTADKETVLVVVSIKKIVYSYKNIQTFSPNWHETGYFYLPCNFGIGFVSAKFVSKISKLFWQWKLTSIGLIWDPAKLIESYKTENLLLGGAKDEPFLVFWAQTN